TEMLRVQNPNLGIDYLQLEKDMRLYETLLYELLVAKKTPSEMVQKNPDYARILKRDFNYMGGDDFLTRNIVFSQSLNDINIIEAWANTESKVLSAWGETDIQIINDFSHREMVRIINQYHPGNATFLTLEGTDHNFVSIPTMEESYKANREGALVSMYPTKFNCKVIDEFDKWMRSVLVNN